MQGKLLHLPQLRRAVILEGVLFNEEEDVVRFLQGFPGGLGGVVVGLLQLNVLELKLAELFALFLDRGGVGAGGLGHVFLHGVQLAMEVLFAGALPGLALEKHGLGELLADAHNGVQAAQGVLEDHGDLVPAQAVEVVLANLQQVLTIVKDLAALHNGVARQDTQNGLGGHGLAGTGLAHDGHGFALVQVKADVPHRLYLAGSGSEGDAQMAYLQFLFHLTPLLSKTG